MIPSAPEPLQDGVDIRAPYVSPEGDRAFRKRSIPYDSNVQSDLESVVQWLDEILAIAGNPDKIESLKRDLSYYRNRLASFTHAATVEVPSVMERAHIGALLHALADRV